MPVRSVRITLSNNTLYNLTLIGLAGPCHGDWTDPQNPWPNGWMPPHTIPSRTRAQWETNSAGFLTGTEGWVRYQIENHDDDPVQPTPPPPQMPVKCRPELVYIHWTNPFIWNPNTNFPEDILNYNIWTSDVDPHCDKDRKGIFWGDGGQSSRGCRHELFPAGVSGPGLSITWADAVFSWPVIGLLTLIGDQDIHLEFTLGLRALGSVDQTIIQFYDGTKGLRSLANAVGEPSVRKLFKLW
jgi:hypothetical protein